MNQDGQSSGWRSGPVLNRARFLCVGEVVMDVSGSKTSSASFSTREGPLVRWPIERGHLAAWVLYPTKSQVQGYVTLIGAFRTEFVGECTVATPVTKALNHLDALVCHSIYCHRMSVVDLILKRLPVWDMSALNETEKTRSMQPRSAIRPLCTARLAGPRGSLACVIPGSGQMTDREETG